MKEEYKKFFIKNIYFENYINIINFFKDKRIPADIYCEKHHILPKSILKDDTDENLIKIPADIHFILHALLPLCLKDEQHKRKLIFSWWHLNNLNKDIVISPDIYSALREYHSKTVSVLHKNKVVSAETRQKISYHAKITNRWVGENNPMYNSKRFGSKNPFYGKRHTEETKKKISEKNLGKAGLPGETNPSTWEWVKEKMRKPKRKCSCYYCNFLAGCHMINRWHNNKCKWNWDNAEEIDKKLFEKPIWY